MIVVVGSGLAAQKLSPGNVGLELLENASVIGAGLFVIINIVGPVSGAHLNPIVSLVDAFFGACSWVRALVYIPTQVVGCILGTVIANVMFDHSWISWSIASSSECATLPLGDRRHRRTDIAGLRPPAQWPTRADRRGGRSVHFRGLLRDLLGHVRQSGRFDRAFLHEQFHRNRSEFTASLHRRTTHRRRRGRGPDSAPLSSTK